MKYTLENGRCLTIPDKELEKNMKLLNISHEEAIHLWLSDNEYEIDEERDKFDAEARKVKIDHDAQNTDKPRKKADKPKVVKVSDAKKALFVALNEFLDEFCQTNDAKLSVLTENKLFSVEFGGENFKIDLIQQRKPKK